MSTNQSTEASSTSTQARTSTKRNPMAGPVTWLDDRVGLAGLMKKQLRKVFPDHWSFMLGEIALWSFVVLLLTGVFLSLWFKPSMAEVEYLGMPPCGRAMSLWKSTTCSRVSAATVSGRPPSGRP